VLRERQQDLQRENEQYRRIIRELRTKSEAEALEMLRAIRESSEPLHLLDTAGEAEEHLSNSSSPETEHVLQLHSLDHQALESSIIKVSARPWTVVASDGLVSQLITNVFTLKGIYLYPVLDKDVFIQEMKSGNVETSKWCTPLLVNAICAAESVSTSVSCSVQKKSKEAN
jgi:hypothetical protein